MYKVRGLYFYIIGRFACCFYALYCGFMLQQQGGHLWGWWLLLAYFLGGFRINLNGEKVKTKEL